MTYTQLEIAHHQASAAYRAVVGEHDNERRALIAAALTKIDASMALKYGERLESLKDAELAAEAAYNAERVATAKPPYPVGTVLIGWKDTPSSWSRTHDWQPVSKGVVEIADTNTVYPANNKYQRYSPGTVIVRVLKVDGSPSRQCEALSGGYRRRWLPEGMTPNGAS